MNTTLKLKKQDQNSKGECPLYIRLRKSAKGGKTEEALIYTSIDVSPKHFKGGSIIPRTPNYIAKQKKITSIITNLEKIEGEVADEGFVPNPSIVKQRYLELISIKEDLTPKYKSFWRAFDEFYETKKHKSRGYTKTFISLKNRLKEYETHKKSSITFDFITGNTVSFQFQLQDYFWTKKKPPLSNGYVNKLFENLSLFLYYSFQQGYIQKKPSFSKNTVVARQEKIYLYREEVIKLFKSNKWDYKEGKSFANNNHIYIIEEQLDGTRKDKFDGVRKITNWELVKDIFLFQCAIGCRYSDIPFFQVKHFDFDKKTEAFTWRQQKTNSWVSVPSNSISRAVFIKYSAGKSLTQKLFPQLSNQKFNKTLKYVLKDLNFNRLVNYPKKIGSKVVNEEDRCLWELISSHSGRRTFIKNMADLGTMDTKTLMTLSGHKTYSEFEKYLSVSPRDIAKGKKLYYLDDPKTDDEVDDMVKIYTQLDDDKKKMVLELMKTLAKSN